jgi:invasion protein IalB
MMMTRRRDPVFVALLALFVCSPEQAASQSTAQLAPPQGDKPSSSEPELAPRGQHMPRDIAYSQWRKFCFKVPGKEVLCRTSITGTWGTGQMAIRIDVIERQGSARFQILLPVGLYLQSGVKLKVDASAREVIVPYNWCFSNLCVAAAPAPREVIRALEKGRILSVGVVDTNLLSVTAAIPVGQFTTAYRGAPAETIEQVIDE